MLSRRVVSTAFRPSNGLLEWDHDAVPSRIADVKEIAGIDFDEASYKRVSQYIYMGALDDNDTLPYPDAYDEEDAELIKTSLRLK